MYTPQGLYERIVHIRQRDGLSADAACEKLAKELQGDAAALWRSCGMWFLLQVERAFFRTRGFDGGHRRNDAHAATAPTEPTAGAGQKMCDAQIVHAGAGQESRDTQWRAAGAGANGATAAKNDMTPKAQLPPSRPGAESGGGQGTDDAHTATAPANPAHETPARPAGGHHAAVAQEGDAAAPAGPGAGGHIRYDAQRQTAPGIPWPLRVDWNWNAEFRIRGVGARRLRDVTREDLERGGRIMKRSAATQDRRGDAMLKLAKTMRPGETLEQAWHRYAGSPEFRRAVAAFLSARASKRLAPA